MGWSDDDKAKVRAALATQNAGLGGFDLFNMPAQSAPLPLASTAANPVLTLPAPNASPAPIQLTPAQQAATAQALGPSSFGLTLSGPGVKKASPGDFAPIQLKTGQEALVGHGDKIEKAVTPVYAPTDGEKAGAEGAGGVSMDDLRKLAPKGSPAHWATTMSPEAQKEYQSYFQKQEAANTAQTEADEGVAAATARGKLSVAGTIEGARLEAEKAEARRQQVIDQHMTDQQKIANDVANTSTNPDDYYGSGGAGVFKRAMLLIAGAMGGYSAGLRGGPNTVQESIDKDIDRFVAGQRAELAKKQSILQQSNSKFGQLIQKFGDERAAAAAMKSDLYAGVQAHAEAMVEDAKTEQQKARGMALAANAQKERAGYENDLRKLVPASGGMSGLQLLELKQKLDKGDVDLQKERAELGLTAANTEKARAEAAKTAKEGGGADNLAALAPLVKGASTNWSPSRNIQGTDAAKHLGAQQRWNAQILSAVHRTNPAAKGLEAMEAVGAPYLINPGDSAETIDRKVKAAQADFGKGGADVKPPSSFEE